DDLVRGVPPALVRCHVVVDSSLPASRATESHNNWTTPKGSPQYDNSATAGLSALTNGVSDGRAAVHETVA
ncbi:hypothetical protein KUF57_17710, partial [Mycolicibacterium sp. PAM1]|uniref:hypothetical protein n=1 Tax=Mycolicibacterium sp. PAM1 TaxID=2853535 RepID=UPI001C3E64B8